MSDISVRDQRHSYVDELENIEMEDAGTLPSSCKIHAWYLTSGWRSCVSQGTVVPCILCIMWIAMVLPILQYIRKCQFYFQFQVNLTFSIFA